MSNQVLMWVGFNIFVVLMLILDLKVFHRRSHVISIKESLLWTAFWIILSLLFNLIVYFWQGQETALEYLTGYLIEKSLSIDNLFVFLLIFSYFAVAPIHQHKVLYWGILGAIFMRLIFILTGIALVGLVHWMLAVFGAFLVLTALRMAFQKDKEIYPEKNPVLRLFRRFMPVTEDYEEDKFFIKRAGRYLTTPLFIVVIVVETTDVVFALDSIPAILGITRDSFIVYSSNIFAILGLRALYFALAGIMRVFHLLHYGLVGVLIFIGVKMILEVLHHYELPLGIEMPVGVALGVVGGVLVLSIIASMLWPRETELEIDTTCLYVEGQEKEEV